MIETAPSVGVFEVEDLDADTVLRVMRSDVVTAERVAARRRLRLAGRWCRLNVLGVGEREDLEGTSLHLAGPGTPWLAAGTADEVAAALGVRKSTAQALLADVLDLEHRLPLILGRVEALEVDVWKARRTAVLTRQLPVVAAAWVDAQLAGRLHQVGLPTIESVVLAAMATWCPDLLAEREKRGRAAWGVRISHGQREDWAGTSWLDAVGDTGDLMDFHQLVCDVAQALADAGDDEPMDALKAKALGLIGRGEHEDLLATASAGGAGRDGTGRDEGTGAAVGGGGLAERVTVETVLARAPRPTTGVRRRLFVHLDADQLGAAMEGEPSSVDVAGFGRVTTDLLEGWLCRTGFVVTPVVDLARVGAVDVHDPPSWMRTLVVLRDRHCVGPYCETDAWACDLDHIEAYRPHGPPGQTHPGNLAPLCRGIHLAKTHLGWRYYRTPEGAYVWTSPAGLRYRVTPGQGTEQLD